MSDLTIYIEDSYKSLSNLEILLDADPIQFGPKRLNNKIQITRDALSTIDKLFIELSQKIQLAKRELLVCNTLFRASRANLLTFDAEVRAGRSAAEREAEVEVKLKDMVTEKNILEQNLAELENLMVVVKAKKSDLKDVRSALREQVTLVHDEIKHLNARWGEGAVTPMPQTVSGSDPLDLFLEEMENSK